MRSQVLHGMPRRAEKGHRGLAGPTWTGKEHRFYPQVNGHTILPIKVEITDKFKQNVVAAAARADAHSNFGC